MYPIYHPNQAKTRLKYIFCHYIEASGYKLLNLLHANFRNSAILAVFARLTMNLG
jgi:hypothetical protein